jgi:hypothetical protein
MDTAQNERRERTKARHLAWWRREGLVIARWSPFLRPESPKLTISGQGTAASIDPVRYWNDPAAIVERVRSESERAEYPGDLAPLAPFLGWGPGSLALYLGSRPDFAKDTVWFFPREDDPEAWPDFVFDPESDIWRAHESTLRILAAQARGRCLIGCPDLVENLDILASLRETQSLMFDLVERPEWVEARIAQIEAVWFEVYGRIRRIIGEPDGTSAYHAFGLWGRGSTAKLQCDASAMISRDMFDRFVLPSLTRQAGRLDNALYHLDGTQALQHLDSLLHIEGLDAIEWTPQAGIEDGGNPRWYSLYRKILEAGKCVQAVHVRPDEIESLLDAIGTRGVYLHLDGVGSAGEFEELAENIHRKYRI